MLKINEKYDCYFLNTSFRDENTYSVEKLPFKGNYLIKGILNNKTHSYFKL